MNSKITVGLILIFWWYDISVLKFAYRCRKARLSD